MGLNTFYNPGKAWRPLCNADHVSPWLFSPSVTIYLVSSCPLANTIPIGHMTTAAARLSLFGPGLEWVNSQVTHAHTLATKRFAARGECSNTYLLLCVLGPYTLPPTHTLSYFHMSYIRNQFDTNIQWIYYCCKFRQTLAPCICMLLVWHKGFGVWNLVPVVFLGNSKQTAHTNTTGGLERCVDSAHGFVPSVMQILSVFIVIDWCARKGSWFTGSPQAIFHETVVWRDVMNNNSSKTKLILVNLIIECLVEFNVCHLKYKICLQIDNFLIP